MKTVTYSQHAVDQMKERMLRKSWVERAIGKPEWIEADPNDPTLGWRLAAVPEFGGRYLRVVVRETEDHFHVITVCLDRRAAKRHARQHVRS
ncbi:DUF4258 domain-containing protein [Brevundimonas sp. TWP2-3-2]|uniref:DUF4258 domain-containing protein n=1 Tax=Brevundimonas sp. TWP2-3-2 TaxID=2804648 RepID=UPI003CF235D8